MKKLKVAVYAICKDEEKFVERWMQSMKEADLVVVTDTGSADGTVQKLKRLGAKVFSEKIEPWRFDVARNISLSHVPHDVDICVCTDLDETFRPGWRHLLEASWREKENFGHRQVHYTYNWRLKADGTPDYTFTYSKIHDRHGWVWEYPIHEYIFLEGEGGLETIQLPALVLDHYPDWEKSRGNYLPLLEMAVKEKPLDGRMNNLLGREYLVTGHEKSAIQQLKAYLALPDTLCPEAQGQAMGWIGNAYWQQGEAQKARKWFLRFLGNCQHRREPYVELSRLAHAEKDWEFLYYLTKAALRITDTGDMFYTLSSSWDKTLDEYALQACYHLAMYQDALAHCAKALAFEPGNAYLLSWQELILSKMT
ncbi:MAG: hypothetical protein FWF59_10320 [Turicibacter sp.]|nr:hypothetical protein [Turicibacter sp.]